MSTASLPIRVLIADDHALLREGIAGLLSASAGIEVVAQAADGREALELYARHRPDVTLMDLQMPLLNGFDALAAIRAADGAARVIMLTTFSGDAHIARALEAGAMGYLLKGALRVNLVEAIRAVHAGQKYIPDEVARELDAWFGSEKLSARELAVLRLVASGHSNKEAAARLAIKEETVKAHVSAVLAKLGARDRTHAVTIAIKRGMLEV
ncbi:MAG: response regulator transcription factor [Pseudomonadota bacterium]